MNYHLALYLRGFNNGYIIAKYEFEILENVLMGLPLENYFVKGLTHGIQEYKLERDIKRKHDFDIIRNKVAKNKETDLDF